MECWIANQIKLLELERVSENEQLNNKIASLSPGDCEEAGISILDLRIESINTGLFGRCCAYFVYSRIGKTHRNKALKVGDEVKIYSPRLKESNSDAIAEGVVSKVKDTGIEVVLRDEIEESNFDDHIRIDSSSSVHTHNKYSSVLKELSGSQHPLADIMFGLRKPPPLVPESAVSATDIDTSLNESQQKAAYSTIQNLISVIHGPPGVYLFCSIATFFIYRVAYNMIFQVLAKQKHWLK